MLSMTRGRDHAPRTDIRWAVLTEMGGRATARTMKCATGRESATESSNVGGYFGEGIMIVS